MKHITGVLERKKSQKNRYADEKTIFYVFSEIIAEEYGAQGQKYILPQHYKGKTLFLSFLKSAWAQEVWLQRDTLAKKLNSRLGFTAVHQIKVTH